ncbi:MAG: hypothetical protein HRO68_06575 [Nitrosopumilus sp.]|nr:hypothetical protein [Nitrosopumilus sp.]
MKISKLMILSILVVAFLGLIITPPISFVHEPSLGHNLNPPLKIEIKIKEILVPQKWTYGEGNNGAEIVIDHGVYHNNHPLLNKTLPVISEFKIPSLPANGNQWIESVKYKKNVFRDTIRYNTQGQIPSSPQPDGSSSNIIYTHSGCSPHDSIWLAFKIWENDIPGHNLKRTGVGALQVLELG